MSNVLIIGAGVVGLSIAYELSKKKKYNIYIFDKNKHIGLENSSKNSEVIHSGVYYKKNSLKNSLCIEGKKLIYKFCRKYKITYLKTGKIFAAQNKIEENYLKMLKKNSILNNVKDIKILNKQKLFKIEPQLNCTKALISPSSGIFDSYKFMKVLYKLCKKRRVKFNLNTKILKITKNNKKFQIQKKPQVLFDYVVNCAGMNAISIARNMFPQYSFPKDNLVKGVYFKTNQKLKISKIIYKAMVPGILKERIDLTPTIRGEYIFGPNVEKNKIDNKRLLKRIFFEEVKKYVPNLMFNKIYFYKIGYRPKIYFKSKKENQDFYIKKMKNHNWINLFGIESPGLTSSLSIAKFVNNILKNEKN